MANSSSVFIVVLNWNQPDDTVECIRSLLKLDYPDYHITLVDNGSTDDSVRRFRRAFDETVELLVNRENLGFSAGNNVGIRHAIENGADYIILLNNDTVVKDRNLIMVLVEAFRNDPTIGLACPTILYYGDPSVPWYAGATYSLWKGGGKHIQHFRHASTPIDAGYATGCCVIASRTVIERIGLLDEAFFLYQEDVDWSLRAKKAGYRVVYVPATTILHKVSQSSRAAFDDGVYSSTTVYYKFRNRVLLIRKHGNWFQKYFLWPIYIGKQIAVHSIAYLIFRRWPKFKAMLRGVFDGVRFDRNHYE